MRKILVVFLLIINLLGLPSPLLDEFNNNINNGYEKYAIISDIDNQYYHFKVIQGINKQKMSFGVLLYNYDAKSHIIEIIINDNKYNLSKTKRGDFSIEAIRFNDDIITINVLDEKQSIRQSVVLHNELSNEYTLQNGLNKGIKFSNVIRNISNQLLLTFIFLSVIIICLIIIVVLAITKKGMFNPERRKKDVFNLRELIDNYTKEAPSTFDNVILEEEKVDDKKEVYKRIRDYEDDDEISIDVENILMTKGYNINYDIISMEEKNKIMLELMRMRDFKEITLEQYKEEVIKLWK